MAEIWLELPFPYLKPVDLSDQILLTKVLLADPIIQLTKNRGPFTSQHPIPLRAMAERAVGIALEPGTPIPHIHQMMTLITFLICKNDTLSFLNTLSALKIVSASVNIATILLEQPITPQSLTPGQRFKSIHQLWRALLGSVASHQYRKLAVELVERGFFLILARATYGTEREDGIGEFYRYLLCGTRGVDSTSPRSRGRTWSYDDSVIQFPARRRPNPTSMGSVTHKS